MPICILREKLLTTIRTGYDILCGLLLACRGGVDYASQKVLLYCVETCERKLLGFREFYVNHHPEKVTSKVYTNNKKDTHLLTNVIKLGVIAKPVRRLVVAISFYLGGFPRQSGAAAPCKAQPPKAALSATQSTGSE